MNGLMQSLLFWKNGKNHHFTPFRYRGRGINGCRSCIKSKQCVIEMV